MAEKDLEKRFDQLLLSTIDNNQNQLKLARSFAVLNTSLLQREQLRIAKKLGEDHARIAELQHKSARIVETARNAVRREAAKETVSEVGNSANEVVITGRIVDENSTGVAGVNVYLSDEKGDIVNDIKSITTDKKGNYRFVLQAAGTTKIASYRVVVATARDNKIHEDAVLLKPATGEIAKRDLVINLSKILSRKVDR